MRTPLSVIRNGIFFLERTLSTAGEETRELLAEMDRAISSSNQIITEMLDFVREHSPANAEFPIDEAIARALREVPLPGSIQLQCAANGEPPITVKGNQDQITRILTNLLQNAVHAMPESGELAVSTSRQEDGKVCVLVRDTGHGIPPENLDKVFDPLFSTKTKGMGLGLTVARRYAGLNGGQLLVESEVGVGTSFRLALSAASPSEES